MGYSHILILSAVQILIHTRGPFCGGISIDLHDSALDGPSQNPVTEWIRSSSTPVILSLTF